MLYVLSGVVCSMDFRDVARLHTVSYVGLHTRQVRYVRLHPAKFRGAGSSCPFLEVDSPLSNRNLSTVWLCQHMSFDRTAGVNVPPFEIKARTRTIQETAVVALLWW
jgi:hypothetical protein